MTTYYRRLVTLAFFALLSLPTFAEEVDFIKDNVRLAIDRAAAEGKLVFLDFWAEYCSPCQLMEKYTFTDPSVIERMNGSYVPVRINIETFDGYDLKAQYNVKLLPTIIVLNSKGKLVARFEESMSATKLNAILAKYDTKKNRIKFDASKLEGIKPGFSPDFDVVAKPNTAINSKPMAKPFPLPYQPVDKPVPVAVAPNIAAPHPLSKENTSVGANNASKLTDKTTFKLPVYGIAPPTTAANNNSLAIKPTKVSDVPTDYKTATPRRAVAAVDKPVTTYAATNASTRVTTVNNTIVSSSTTRSAAAATESFTKGSFTIQVGNFVSKDNATRMSATMKTQMEGKQKVFLLSGGSTSLITHRVMVGGFKTHKEAAAFKKKNQINGFVQNYLTFMK